MSKLATRECIPCKGGVPALSIQEKNKLILELHPDWSFNDSLSRLIRICELNGFNEPMQLANKIALIANEQWHHPDLHISFNRLKIEIWTHKIGDLVESDFIFAAKVDQLIVNRKE